MSTMKPQPGKNDRQAREVGQARWETEANQRSTAEDRTPSKQQVWLEMAVQEVHDNYLVCRAWDGLELKGVNVNVAKDPELRQSARDGMTINGLSYEYTGPQARTVTKESDSSTKDQIIIPMYDVPADGPENFPGSIITAAPIATRVLADDGATVLHCQLREFTQRAYANVEGS